MARIVVKRLMDHCNTALGMGVTLEKSDVVFYGVEDFPKLGILGSLFDCIAMGAQPEIKMSIYFGVRHLGYLTFK